MPGLPNAQAEVRSGGPARHKFDPNTPHDVAPACRIKGKNVSWSADGKVRDAIAFVPRVENKVEAALAPKLRVENKVEAALAPKLRVENKGWLYKKGGKLGTKGWDKRWFALVDDKLSYFKNPGDANPKGVIEIRDISEVCSPAPR